MIIELTASCWLRRLRRKLRRWHLHLLVLQRQIRPLNAPHQKWCGALLIGATIFAPRARI